MRVITGSAKGRRLEMPPGLDTRPTAARVKEAAFSIVQFEIEGAAVLDLFAGSGQMGIEALSRGARSCVFVETDRVARDVIRRNLEHVKFGDKARLVPGDAVAFLRKTPTPFDIAFLDPPYKAGLLPEVLALLAPLVTQSGAVLCESARAEEMPRGAGELVLLREYPHGKTKLALYRKEETSTPQ